MANFEQAYIITLGHEGEYSNDPDDVGGETYKGIARKYHPDWEGWSIIDNLKDKPNFPANLNSSNVLDMMTKRLYKQNYWNRFIGDDISNQQIANELFDTGVNMGISRAVKYLQIALNVMNRNQALYPDIVEDGKFGTNTLNALIEYLNNDESHYLYKIMNILQGMHYIEYMQKSPTQEKYARGWLKRVTFTKN